MIHNLWSIGYVTYSDNLIYGQDIDLSVAQHKANINDINVWQMLDKSLRTFWGAIPTQAVPKPTLEFTFAFPIIFEKLVIVKRIDQPKLR